MSNKIIGFDLDNTIVDYKNSLTHISEYLYGYSKKNKSVSKNEIKSFVINKYDESKWTNIQGILYSFFMEKALIDKNFFKLIDFLVSKKYEIVIVSHRSVIPDSGDPYDLQLSARKWINKNIIQTIDRKKIRIDYFLLDSYSKKIEKIKKIAPLFFIDDLLSVCNDVKSYTRPILFGNDAFVSNDEIISINNFSNILKYFRKIL